MSETWVERFERLLELGNQQQAWKQITVDFVEAAKLNGWSMQEAKYKVMADLAMSGQAPFWPLMEIWIDRIYGVVSTAPPVPSKKHWWQR
jgi:hypothetical protein